MLTADQQAQAAADARYAGVAGPQWRVCLGGHPCVTLPAENRGQAIGRYYELVGITASAHPPYAEPVDLEPVAGLVELPEGEDGK